MPIASEKAFTQNWLQSLTLVAQNPVAQSIKPLFNAIDDICRVSTEADRMAAAQKLWDFAGPVGLQSILGIVPAQQPVWNLDPGQIFACERTSLTSISDFVTWSKEIGVQTGDFPLTASVLSSDWSTLVQREAVRLKKTFDTSTTPHGKNLKMPCTAKWNGKTWTVVFDDTTWITMGFDDPFTVNRPTMPDIEETLTWSIATASETLLPKTASKIMIAHDEPLWLKCVPKFEPFHRQVLGKQSGFSPWFKRVWSCVWPIVYREQSQLKGLAELDYLRQELVACIQTAPQVTVWNFVFAKLLCQIQLSWGLGICGNYRD